MYARITYTEGLDAVAVADFDKALPEIPSLQFSSQQVTRKYIIITSELRMYSILSHLHGFDVV